MKPKILIVLADYYKKISVEMLDSTINLIDKKSKWGVSPFITQPNAINASYFFMFLEIVIGISKHLGL